MWSKRLSLRLNYKKPNWNCIRSQRYVSCKLVPEFLAAFLAFNDLIFARVHIDIVARKTFCLQTVFVYIQAICVILCWPWIHLRPGIHCLGLNMDDETLQFAHIRIHVYCQQRANEQSARYVPVQIIVGASEWVEWILSVSATSFDSCIQVAGLIAMERTHILITLFLYNPVLLGRRTREINREKKSINYSRPIWIENIQSGKCLRGNYPI